MANHRIHHHIEAKVLKAILLYCIFHPALVPYTRPLVSGEKLKHKTKEYELKPKESGNFSSSINTWIFKKKHIVEDGNTGTIEPLIFWVDIGLSALIFISRY